MVAATGVGRGKLLEVCRIEGEGRDASVHLQMFVQPRSGRILRPPRLRTRRWATSSLGLREGAEGKRGTDGLGAGVPRGIPGPRPHSYSVMRLASSVQAAVELAENTR